MSVDALLSRAALVTGAGAGAGHLLAGRLAASGWTVIVHAGTVDIAQDAVQRLVKAGAEPLRLEVVSGEFARLGEVARIAGEVAQRYPSLDLLVNAAHAGPAERRRSPRTATNAPSS
jgi:NAD(P)-dependent dehydrogenase (short-subunit alcohol dehydrogenase family)